MKKLLLTLIFIFCLLPLFANGQEEKITAVDDFNGYTDWTRVNMETI